MGNKDVAIFGSSNLRGVNMFHNETEQVAVPHVDQCPNISTVEILKIRKKKLLCLIIVMRFIDDASRHVSQ